MAGSQSFSSRRAAANEQKRGSSKTRNTTRARPRGLVGKMTESFKSMVLGGGQSEELVVIVLRGATASESRLAAETAAIEGVLRGVAVVEVCGSVGELEAVLAKKRKTKRARIAVHVVGHACSTTPGHVMSGRRSRRTLKEEVVSCATTASRVVLRRETVEVGASFEEFVGAFDSAEVDLIFCNASHTAEVSKAVPATHAFGWRSACLEEGAVVFAAAFYAAVAAGAEYAEARDAAEASLRRQALAVDKKKRLATLVLKNPDEEDDLEPVDARRASVKVELDDRPLEIGEGTCAPALDGPFFEAPSPDNDVAATDRGVKRDLSTAESMSEEQEIVYLMDFYGADDDDDDQSFDPPASRGNDARFAHLWTKAIAIGEISMSQPAAKRSHTVDRRTTFSYETAPETDGIPSRNQDPPEEEPFVVTPPHDEDAPPSAAPGTPPPVAPPPPPSLSPLVSYQLHVPDPPKRQDPPPPAEAPTVVVPTAATTTRDHRDDDQPMRAAAEDPGVPNGEKPKSPVTPPPLQQQQQQRASRSAFGTRLGRQLPTIGENKRQRLAQAGIVTIEGLADVDLGDTALCMRLTGNRSGPNATRTVSKWKANASSWLRMNNSA